LERHIDNVAETDLVAVFLRHYGSNILSTLLKDHSTEKNIVWADTEYQKLGLGYAPYDEITCEKIADRNLGTVEPRVTKNVDKQAWRTRSKAEVFTPSWLCAKMVDALDDAFFGNDPKTFDEALGGLTPERMSTLSKGKLWRRYIDNRLLEITCGEAPFICSPYDATTGEFVSVENRIGFLDRKLKVVSANAETFEDWLKWAYRALEASYGYEFQGDNLLIARINVFNTFSDYMETCWGRRPNEREARHASLVISWNLWQMDGLRGCAPSEWEVPEKDLNQLSLFDMSGFMDEETQQEGQMRLAVSCKIYDWRARKPQMYESLKGTW
jgi:hypothetical protein